MTTIPSLELLADDALARGLLEHDPRVAGLLAHDPGSAAGLLESARVAAGRAVDRDALATALEAGLRRVEAPDAAFAAAARLRTPGTVAVVTGQQPGLLGGSLMVLVKALAAAAVARRIEAAGVPAVPVFWHASEDHDHGEADHVGWLHGGMAERLRLPLPGDGRMLSHTPVPVEAAALVERVLSELALGPGHAVLADVLPARPDESFATWTGRLLARVLGAQGIVLVEPRSLRELGSPVVRHERTHPGELRSAVARAEARVAAAGYAPALGLRRDALYFDVDGAGRRLPPSGTGPSPASGAVSWNVVTRVLAQDLVLPVAAQVCGPAELAYVSLMREAHDALGAPQPAAVLRPGMTIVDPTVRRACARLGVAPEAVVRRGDAALPPPEALAEAELSALRAAVAALPPSTSPAAERRRRALARETELYAEALLREAADADAVRGRRVATVLEALQPGGRRQERVLSFLPWFAAGGDAVMARIVALLGTGDSVHHVLRTEDL